jgi:hypothetical protein
MGLNRKRFGGYSDKVSDPAKNFRTIVPDDANDIGFEVKGLIFGTTGNVTLIGEDGQSAAIGVLAGVVYPFSPNRINSTAHTAGTVVGLY